MSEYNGGRLIIDMDGTLTRFHDQVDFLERMYEKMFQRRTGEFIIGS